MILEKLFFNSRFVFRRNHSEGADFHGDSGIKKDIEDVKETAVSQRAEIAASLADSLVMAPESSEEAAVKQNNGDFASFIENAQDKALENSEFAGVNLEYHNGVALYQDKESGKWGFVDANGKKLGTYEQAWQFNDGAARVRSGVYSDSINQQYNYIDIGGKKILPEDVDTAFDFSDGVALIGSKGKYNFIDLSGEKIFPEDFDYASQFVDGLAVVARGGKYNFIDLRGNNLLADGVDFAWGFKDGFAKVEKGGKYNLVDMRGNILLDEYATSVEDFSDGLAKVQVGDDVYSIDTRGRRV